MDAHLSGAKSELSPAQGRLLIVLAAVLWSTSSFFNKILTKPTSLGLHEPSIEAFPLAFFRVLFAGLFLVPTLRKKDISFRPFMLVMAISFAVMNLSYMAAMTWGKAATAVLLQYTAPMWMYCASIWLLNERPRFRNTMAVGVGLLGVIVIMIGQWGNENPWAVSLGLTSGVTYGAILICLRILRNESANWLTIWNQLAGALVLLPFFFLYPLPRVSQLAVLVLFGAFQLGLPYWLMARGLRVVSPQEAGAITLLEPVLNAIWAYLVSPETETPTTATYIGGGLILGGLAYRYWPSRTHPADSIQESEDLTNGPK
ncbi:MAG: DMT family transporter [Gemmataceae bacterium]